MYRFMHVGFFSTGLTKVAVVQVVMRFMGPYTCTQCEFMGPSTHNLDWHYVIAQYKCAAQMNRLLGVLMDGHWVV